MNKELEFLIQSNYIEREFSPEAIEDAEKTWIRMLEHACLSPGFVLEAHGILMKRINPRIAGKWRDCDVWIGRDKKKFISKEVLESQVGDVCEKINNSILYPKAKSNKAREELIKQLHVEFEEVHPFEDGNGRTGRIIMNWHRLRLGLPVLVIQADLRSGGREQLNYYKWFQESK